MKTNGEHGTTGYNSTQFSEGWTGLTKREYFAAMALQGLSDYSDIEYSADKAVKLADALITALNNQEK